MNIKKEKKYEGNDTKQETYTQKEAEIENGEGETYREIEASI